jgi:tape measure domain-containing protein
MSEETKIIYIRVDASKAVDGSTAATRAFERMEKAQNQAAQSLDRMERSQGTLASSMAKLEGVTRNLFGAFLGAQGVRAVIDAADAFTKFSNSLKVAGVQGEALGLIQGRLFAAANKNGVEVGALGQLYGRVAMTSKELGASQSDMLKFVDGVTAALRVQGGSTEQASGALLQLSQAMGAGIVRAEEFNSILEGALPVAQAAARGIDGMGGSVAKLRAAVVDGNITSRQFFEGLLRGFGQTKIQAESASLTISGAVTGMSNSWVGFVGAMDQAVGASKLMVSAINSLARGLENLSSIAKDARSNITTLLSIAANPGGFVGSLLTSITPAEKLAADIDKQRKIIATTEAALATPNPNNIRNRHTEAALAAARDKLAGLERQQIVAQVGGKATPAFQDDPDNIGIVVTRPAPTITKKTKDGGDGDRRAAALQDAQRELDAARAFADAANLGADAVARLDIHFKALKTAQDVFSKTANDNSGAAQELAAKLEASALATLKLKNLGEFRSDTKALRDQNELLEAEIRLTNELPEVRARELATLKVMQEVKAKGLGDNKQEIADRIAVMETNERLKIQGEELKRANEMWTEPLKNALQSIQSTAADWVEKLLDGLGQGKLAVEDFGKAGIAIAKRMVAEFLALALIRPMMGSLVSSMSSLGLVSPSTAASLGYGSSATGAGGGLGGIGGGGGLPSFGGMGNSSMFGFLNRPIFPGSMPAGQYGPPQPGLGGVTWGQGLGALAGVGMGAFQLANAKGNTGKTIGGIASMVGGAVSLIPGIGQIAGPVIGLLGGLFGGLFGGEEYKWDPMAGANTRFTPGVKKPTIHSTEINGGESIGGRYARTWGVIDELLRATGGTIDPARAWSGDIWNNQRDGYSSVALIGPNGESRFLAGGEGDRSQDLDTLIASVFSANVKNGGLTGISDTLMKAVNNREPGNEQEVRDLLSLIDAYDKFGKVIPTAKPALEEIAKKFATMTETARLYGLALDPIAAERKKVTERYARDFIDQFVDPLAVELRALDDERKDAIASAEYIRDHVANVYVDINKITETFLKRESDLREQAYDGALKSLDDAIRRMTPGGDLANMNDTATLAGLRATFDATTAQAMAGNSAAIARLTGEGTALAEYGSRYYAGNADYNALRDEILANFMQVQAQLQPSTSTPAGQGGQADPNAAATAQLVQQLMAANQQQAQRIDGLLAELTRTTGLLKRYLGRAA